MLMLSAKREVADDLVVVQLIDISAAPSTRSIPCGVPLSYVL